MKIVPSTKLRAFYEFLAYLRLSNETQKSIMKDLTRKENHKRCKQMTVTSMVPKDNKEKWLARIRRLFRWLTRNAGERCLTV